MNVQVRYSDPEPSAPPSIESLLVVHKFNEGKKLFQEQELTISSSVRDTYLQGLSYQNSENWHGAVEAYKRLVKLLPWRESYYMLAHAYFKLGEFEEAAYIYKKLIKRNPTDVEALFSLGLMYLLLGKMGKALKSITKVVKLNSQHKEVHFFLGYVHSQLQHREPAIEAYEEAIRINKKHKQAYFYLASLYIDLGNRLRGERKHFFSKAIETYRRLLKVYPKDSIAYNNIGVLYSRMGDSKSALEAYESAVKTERSNLRALLNLGAQYLDLMRYQDARLIFEQAIEEFKRTSQRKRFDYLMAHVYNGLGVALLSLHLAQSGISEETELLSEAKEAFNSALELNPHYALAQNNLGAMYQVLGRLEDAERAFKKALELDPSNSMATENIQVIKEAQLERRLFELGFLKKIRKPITDLTPYQNRRLLEVKGKPLSETIIEERG